MNLQIAVFVCIFNLVGGYFMDYMASAHRTVKGHIYLLGLSLVCAIIANWFPISMLAFLCVGVFVQAWILFAKQGSLKVAMRINGKLDGIYVIHETMDIDREALRFCISSNESSKE